MPWWLGGWWVFPLLCLGMMALCVLAALRGGFCGMGHRDSHGGSGKGRDT